MILTGIITYNPNLERLYKNIMSILSQVDDILLVDNNSENINNIQKICEIFGIHIIKNLSNIGLAGALNQVFNFYPDKYEWVLILDQDSILPGNYIEKAKRYMGKNKVGIICASYFETNLGTHINRRSSKIWEYRKRCITSGSIVQRKAYKESGGYDEILSVDYVDFDFSVKIRRKRYTILRMNDVIFEHELGESEMKRFLFWKFRLTKHSADREFLIARNIVIFIKRYWMHEIILRDFLSLLKHFILIILYDNDRFKKLTALLSGIKDGLRLS